MGNCCCYIRNALLMLCRRCKFQSSWLCLAIMCFFANTLAVNAQKADSLPKVPFDFNRDLQEQLPPLDSLMILARKNSPMLRKYLSFTLAQKEKIQLAKKSWSSNLQLQGNYSMGNQSLLLSGTAASDLNQLSNGYRVGVNIGLPLYEVLTRGNRIKLAKAEAQASVDQLAEASQILDKEIIDVYQQMLASFRQWRITQTLVEKSAISEMLAEKKLNENQIALADFTRISEIKSAADNRKFESEKLFFGSYYTLQVLLGVPLNSLKR